MNQVFNSYKKLAVSSGDVGIYSLPALEAAGLGSVSRIPYSIRVLLESQLRNFDGESATEADIAALAAWNMDSEDEREISFLPARVLLQDFTGVPAVVDLAALRSAMARLGGDPKRINPLIPVDLVIDHSLQIDKFGADYAMAENCAEEFKRNRERYEFLKWGQSAFENFRVVPPSTGICHQVNLERLACVVQKREINGALVAFPDTLVGTDSHTTMINGLGVLGWGVGGIEAEAAMLGQPISMLVPKVVGARLVGELRPEVTATDLVLTVTQALRNHGVVGKFVEFFGPGIRGLTLPDRATLANMGPEYGATMGFFPVDALTLEYLKATGRERDLIDLVERYTKEQTLFRTEGAADPVFNETLEIDLSAVEPCLAGPRRPQERVALQDVKKVFFSHANSLLGKEVSGLAASVDSNPTQARSDSFSEVHVPVSVNGAEGVMSHGSVVIASITSCTNTSNPSSMIEAGIVAKRAVEKGLAPKPWVKTSLAPGSRAVTKYLDALGLTPYLEALKFHNVGYGCATCIGNSGPLPQTVDEAAKEKDLVVASVLSGNRNFEGRVHPLTKANFLASPALVVAYAIAGTVDVDLKTEPLGTDPNGKPVYLKDLWPTREEVAEVVKKAMNPEDFKSEYEAALKGDALWNAIETNESDLYAWDAASTYIQEPPFFQDMTPEPPGIQPIKAARALALLGDFITTDHISPAGAIAKNGPAAKYLESNGLERNDFNSFGSRRGNHEVMMRGTFANVRLRNRIAPGTEGGVTVHLPTGENMSIFDASERYMAEGTPLVVIAGKGYGMGSSRDWAAKGTLLLGVRAVIAENYERIHRSNLIGMGVLPLQFEDGQTAESLGLTGTEVYDILELGADIKPGQMLKVAAKRDDGTIVEFSVKILIFTPAELDYCKNGGILHAVLRGMAQG